MASTEGDRLSQSLRERLRGRQVQGSLRELTVWRPKRKEYDFASNDYVGLARHPRLPELTQLYLHRYGDDLYGSTGSRILTGNSVIAEDVEKRAANLHRAETATLFNSGFAALQGLLGCIASPDDAILSDILVHASTQEGIRTSRAGRKESFGHNDLKSMEAELENLLQSIEGSVIVVVESMYSMDGDLVPLRRLLTLCERVGGRRVSVIIDEAHAAGVFGENGAGYVCERKLEQHPNLFARTVTLGKAFGVEGAFVLGPKVLREYLLNYARPLVFSTALSRPAVAAVHAAYELMQNDIEVRASRAHVALLSEALQRTVQASKLPPNILAPHARHHINAIMVQGPKRCLRVATALQELGFGVMAIRAPTVPLGSERIRITLHSYNTASSIEDLVQNLERVLSIEVEDSKL